ncbi:MAG: dihydrodipicolinate synthase family protein [Thermoproteales archaeon]|nr:dihydrodipicolinate synthase family protein [Thermoproteales archaeon]
MQRKEFKGVFPPIITVFNKDESINIESFKEHVDWLIENGADGIIVGGSTGEFFNMTLEERKKMIDITIDHVNGRVPVLAGTADCSTRMTIELCKYAEDAGADGVLIVPPYYYKPNDIEIYEHYKAISRAIDIPIMLYNNPGASKVYVNPDLLVKMAKDNIISYVKETHGDVAFVHEIILKGNGEKPVVFFGRDENAFEAFIIGAVGWVSGAANATIKLQKKIFVEAVINKNYQKARELYYRILPWFLLTERRGRWLAYVKAALKLMGMDRGNPRRPILPLNKKEEKEVEEVLTKIGLL